MITQPLTVETLQSGAVTRNQKITFSLDMVNNAVSLINFRFEDQFNSVERTPNIPVPILNVLDRCSTDLNRREEFDLTEIPDNSDDPDKHIISTNWFNLISTLPAPLLETEIRTFHDVCSLEVREPPPDDVNGTPLQLYFNWKLSPGYGIIEYTQEFDNDELQISTIATSDIPSFWSGSLTVSILPVEAVNSGARWRVIREGTTDVPEFQTSGTQLDDIEQGLYTLEFNDIEGWDPPQSRTISISTDPVSIAETYTRETGMVSITIGPSDVGSLGAGWRIKNDEFDSGLHMSGVQISNVPVGEYTLTFQEINDWVIPDSQLITVEDGILTSIPQANYVRISGGVSITIMPAEAITAQAQWKVLGLEGSFESQFLNSDEPLRDVPTGEYFLQAKDIDGWVSLDQIIAIEENVTYQGSIDYVRDEDNDEMEDSWELTNLGSMDALPHNDEDGDGYSNLQEYRNERDPMNYSISLTQGWNLLSLSTIPPMNGINEIFSDIQVYPLAWTQDRDTLKQTDAITDALAGFWVYQKGGLESVEINQNLQINNGGSRYDLRLDTGWNLISINRVPENNSIEEIFNGFTTSNSVWKWEKNQFVMANKLDPLSGYWVHFNGDEAVNVPIEVTLE